jgi:NADH:ubiquinone oxidoreductase subunit 6 (subunit J)
MSIFIHGGESSLFYLFSTLCILSGIMVIRSKNPVHSVLFLILVFCNASGLLILLGLDFFAMVFLVVYVGAIAVLFLFVVMMLNIKLVEINENILRYLPIGGLIGLIFLFEIFLIIDSDLIPILEFPKKFSTDFFLSSGLFNAFLTSLFLIRLLINFQENVFQIVSIFSAFKQDLDEFLVESSLSFEKVIQTQQQIMDPFFFTQWSNLVNASSNIESIGALIYTYYFYFFLVASLILLVSMIGAIVLTMHRGVAVKRQEIFEQNSREFTKTIQKIEINNDRIDAQFLS